MSGNRYWRLYITAVDGSSVAVVTEVEFRASLGGADETGSVGGSAVATSTFADPAYTPAHAFDNGAGEWASASIPAGIGWDAGFGTTLPPIEQVAVTNRTTATVPPTIGPQQAPSAFAVQYSDDGVTYYDYWSVSGSTGWAVGETRTFNNPFPPTGGLETNALAQHTAIGGPRTAIGAASVVMHTAVGAATTEEWVSSVAMHTVRGGRAAMAAVDDLVMHTVFGPGTPVPANQRIRVSLVCRTRQAA